MSKASDKIYLKRLEIIKPIFENFFSAYYSDNRNISAYSLFEMKENSGYCAKIEYKKFTQYVRFNTESYLDSVEMDTVFEFKSSRHDFLCGMVDILNVIDSDDISFYIYNDCLTENSILYSLNEIMSATEKYFGDIEMVAENEELKNDILNKYLFFEDEVIAREKGFFDDLWDVESFCDYELIGINNDLNAFLSSIKKKGKKSKLETTFEKRMYRIIAQNKTSDILSHYKKEQKAVTSKNSKLMQFYQAVPYIISAVIFAVLFGFAAYKIDKNIYSSCLYHSSTDAVMFIGMAGAFFGAVVAMLIPIKAYKLMMSKKKFEEFESLAYMSKAPRWIVILAVIGSIVVTGVFSFMAFSGLGFKQDSIVKKDTTFSQMQEYKYDEIEVIYITQEYTETGYAFKLGDEVYEYGVPSNKNEEALIEENIKKSNTKTTYVEYLEDIQ